MGGKGSGGARVGAGRKPKSAAAHILAGTATAAHRAVVVAPPRPLEVVPEPADLGGAAGKVWQQLAPLAAEQRTLTPATAADFRELCELVAEAREVLTERRAEGWSDRGIKLAKEYRGLVQRAEAKMRGFRLAPIGKEMAPAAPEKKDPWEEFDTVGRAN